MKKIVIILLAAFLLAVSICACEILDAGNSDIDRETSFTTDFHETTSGNVTSNNVASSETTANITSYRSSIESPSIESWISGNWDFNLMNIIENIIYTVGNWNLGLNLPVREIDSIQNNQPDKIHNSHPAFYRGRQEQLPPAITREELVRRGIPHRDELNNFMQEQPLQLENITSKYQTTSNYQTYVTPDAEAVISYLKENNLDDKYEIYEASLSWTWVSDETLNNAEEKWLTPTEFLDETPAYSSNPAPCEPSSDCEEQANTLASLLIASGEYNESTVRVAIGKVDFGDVSGGHAWVEVCENGEWFPLDPTEGPYYDDESSELVPVDSSDVDYDQYSDSVYPVVEIWYYYNNEYFMDLDTHSENAPVSWNNIPKSYQKIQSGKL